MKILLTPDSFKGSLTAIQVCDHLKTGLLAGDPNLEVAVNPVSDGGDGFLEALEDTMDLEIRSIVVQGPLSTQVTARWGMTPNGQAIIEMAQAAGIVLLDNEKNHPLEASTYGVGELILDALNHDAKEIIVGLGGSATTDGGTGTLTAMGYRFQDGTGQPILRGNQGLGSLKRIEYPSVLPGVNARFIVASDVTNPLTGRRGSAITYGPQKGASPTEVSIMETNMCHFAEVVRKATGQDPNAVHGAGAAGGLGAAMAIFLNARVKRGFDVVNELTGLEFRIRKADVVITGEGKMDEQTLNYGKAPMRIAELCRKYGRRCIAIGGFIENPSKESLSEQFDQVLGLTDDPRRMAWAIRNAGELLEAIGEKIGRDL